tara:strand:+ start:12516 stop:14375 length:1860 start_codon:yes stop_codon:yes gene_type:complete
MKQIDELVEEVMNEIIEGYSPAGSVGHPIGASASANGPYTPDSQKFKGIDPDEEGMERFLAEVKKDLKVTWETLPQPSVTELQWADPTSAERAELEAFLNKVAPGKNLGEKLGKIQDVIEKGFTKKTAMSTVLSYLVFLKTLTYIITSFNSASAGFTFESFLGVLLGGKQIPAGGNTIADYIDGEGEFVSLKLLGVRGSEGTDSASTIDGSFTQLIDDLSGSSVPAGGKMKYIIALKDLQGEGDKLGGVITVYEFTFSRDNLADLMELTPKSRAAFSLIKPEYRDRWSEEDYKMEFEDWLERAVVQDEGDAPDETIVAAAMSRLLNAPIDTIVAHLGALGLELSDDITRTPPEGKSLYSNAKSSNTGVRETALGQIRKELAEDDDFITAVSKYIYEKAYTTVKAKRDFEDWKGLSAQKREDPKTNKPDPSSGDWSRGKKLDKTGKAIKGALTSLWDKQTADLPTRKDSTDAKKGELKKAKEEMIMSFDDSVAELSKFPKGKKGDAEYYDHIKKYSMGYGGKGEPQFQLTQNDVMTGRAGSGVPIGKLTVGREAVERALKQSVNDINEKMFAAFNKMSELSKSLQNFFLKGLRSKEGTDAISASRGIAKDTGDLMKQKNK